MTPKEKAKELFDKMTLVCEDIDCHHSLDTYIKQCALIAVDEILLTLNGVWADVAGTTARSCQDTLNHQKYWQQTKEAINQI